MRELEREAGNPTECGRVKKKLKVSDGMMER
jgi:hypothetical protein